ncbi:MAG: N-methyl-L-tryptophan oxidase [Candidatus Hydrogenedentes bacterium]|nr:N-methyl-L-tryptophan oxidase [Candidatus Hydrogenedentota bacterium]
MKHPTYDAIVLGLGGMGSAALYSLAKRGLRVCGVERHGIAHDQGSSHGGCRMIRKAYHEHPDYVPLLNSAYDLWNELEAACGRNLLVRSGLLLSGAPGSDVIAGLESCYAQHDLPHERIDAAEARRRYPQIMLPEDFVAYVDPIGGYLLVESCIEQQVALAQSCGADVLIHHDVLAWHADGNGITLTTERGELHAGNLVVTAGPWAASMLAQLGAPVHVLRKVQLWYTAPTIAEYRGPEFPAYYVERDYGAFYGFPAFTEEGMKIAEHTGGDPVDDPDELNRGLEPGDEVRIRQFLKETFPEMEAHRTRFSVCMYSMSPDRHFIVDKHPVHENVTIAGGFSGHGYKFASVMGEILADLCLEGSTSHPIDLFRIARFK